MRISSSLVQMMLKKWDDQETQDLIQAMSTELKKDARHARNSKDAEFCTQLSDTVMDQNFWDQMDFLLNDFQFEF